MQVVYLDYFSNLCILRYERYTMGRARKPYHSNILAISGTGRNVGKTTLTCGIIKKLGMDQKPTAVKISPHFHEVDYDNPISEEYDAYSIYKEDRNDRGKDSSKMLAAGADRVFYIQAKDDHLGDVWRRLSQNIKKDMPVIIESGGIDEIIEPGLSILVTKTGYKKSNKEGRSSRQVMTCFEHFDHIINKINFKEGNWEIRK